MGLALWESGARSAACIVGMLLVLRSRVCVGSGSPNCGWDRSGGVGIGALPDDAAWPDSPV